MPAPGRCTTCALQTLEAAPVQKGFTRSPAPRALSPLPVSTFQFFSIVWRQPSVTAAPPPPPPISPLVPPPLTPHSSLLPTKHLHCAKSRGSGTAGKTSRGVGPTQGRNNAETNTKRDFHSSKRLREQVAKANEAHPQAVLLHCGFDQHKRREMRGSPRCAAAPETWGLPTGLDVSPHGKNFLSNRLASSASFLRKSWESGRTGDGSDAETLPESPVQAL